VVADALGERARVDAVEGRDLLAVSQSESDCFRFQWQLSAE
jgi:hypothetical protein